MSRRKKRKPRTRFGAKLRSSYKTDKNYIAAVYRANKDFIDTKQMDTGTGEATNKEIFYNNVVEYMNKKGVGVEKAVELTLKSRTYQSQYEMYKSNVKKALISKNQYKEFRELSKENGRYTKFEAEKLRYTGKNETTGYKEYIYDDKVKISFLIDYRTGETKMMLTPLTTIKEGKKKKKN